VLQVRGAVGEPDGAYKVAWTGNVIMTLIQLVARCRLSDMVVRLKQAGIAARSKQRTGHWDTVRAFDRCLLAEPIAALVLFNTQT
jgi:hypothetical protein